MAMMVDTITTIMMMPIIIDMDRIDGKWTFLDVECTMNVGNGAERVEER